MPTPENPQPVPALNNTLASKLDPKAKRQQSNSAGMLALLAALRQQEATIREGGGTKAIEAQHAKQRLTARERIALLLDPGTELFELGAYAAFDMYAEWGGAPAAGVICGLGRVSGRLSMIVANDATVKAGAFFPMTAKKVLRAQHIAMENHLPTLYLVDSSGIFLPLQEDVFPDQDDFGRIFRNNARMSAMGIPQITAIMGMCVAGGAYLPVMTDHVLMTEGSGLFLAGPALVEAAIGQKVFSRRTRRRDHARRDLRHRRLQGAQRSSVHCTVTFTRLEARPSRARALRSRSLRRRKRCPEIFRRRSLRIARS